MSDPVMQKDEAVNDSGSAPAHSLSEDDSAPTVSPADDGVASTPAESGPRDGEMVPTKPVDNKAPQPTEAAPAENQTQQASEDAEQSNAPREDSLSASDGKDPAAVSDPVMQKDEAGNDSESTPARSVSEDDSAPTVSPADDGVASAPAESGPQDGETVPTKPVDNEAPRPTEAAPAENETQQASEDAEQSNAPRQDSLSASDGKDPAAVSDPVMQKDEAGNDSESTPARSVSEDDSAPTVSPADDGVASAPAESGPQDGETVPTKPVDNEAPRPAEAAPAENEAQQASEDAEQSRRQPIFSAIVHKGGTAAYANSEAARKEFPRLDLGVRGAISIARRMQDPLSELAKIQPKTIVAGPDPHEVDPQRLKRTLNGTVESCINQVGVDVNTAPAEMLAHVAGLNTSLAQSIVEYRRQHGAFSSRSQLMEVPGFTDTSFEQAAGFLRVPESEQPLDRTAVHPECYSLVEEMAGSVQATVAELMDSPEKLKALDLEKLSNDRFGLPTLQDIRRELSRRGRDRRKAFVPPSFREDVKELSDLQKGMLVEGTVSNVTSFGAFVDIGVQQEGLIHISELSSRFVQDANQAVHVGQVVKAKVIGVDTDTNRISLSIKALRVREDSRKRKKKKPLKTDSRASTPKPRHAPTDGKGNHQEKRRSAKPERKPVSRKGRQGKKRQSTVVKTAAIQRNRPKTPEPEVLPDTSNLSFSEKIRLLQEKFSGIR